MSVGKDAAAAAKFRELREQNLAAWRNKPGK
jgi:hypothetical protein